MTAQDFATASGEPYCLLGAAFGRKDLWMVRHHQTQELSLLQRFPRPSAGLTRLLGTRQGAFPTVKECWMHQGAVYVLFERVEGLGLEQLGPGGLAQGALQQLKGLCRSMQRLGYGDIPAPSLCLVQDGTLRLRYFPGEAPGLATPLRITVRTKPRRRWLSWLFGR